MPDEVFTPGMTAIVTDGGHAGIGLAAASRVAEPGLRVAIADLDAERRLASAAETVAARAPG